MSLSERIHPKDADMKEVPVNKERNTTYGYASEDLLRFFFYLYKKLLKPAEAAKLVNVNLETARKWKSVARRPKTMNSQKVLRLVLTGLQNGNKKAPRGKLVIEETTSAGGVSHTVIGEISAYGVVNSVAAAIPKGTTAVHFVQLITDTLDIMDEFPNVKGFHIVMNNAPTHPRDVVDPIVS
ncbi:hypothetical protein BY458DRAFT_553659 [Sporodiniella umbellata]|nr:hypothetical protein BY458DRAFT_553659 [Sporodiniella umbellata]